MPERAAVTQQFLTRAQKDDLREYLKNHFLPFMSASDDAGKKELIKLREESIDLFSRANISRQRLENYVNSYSDDEYVKAFMSGMAGALPFAAFGAFYDQAGAKALQDRLDQTGMNDVAKGMTVSGVGGGGGILADSAFSHIAADLRVNHVPADSVARPVTAPLAAAIKRLAPPTRDDQIKDLQDLFKYYTRRNWGLAGVPSLHSIWEPNTVRQLVSNGENAGGLVAGGFAGTGARTNALKKAKLSSLVPIYELAKPETEEHSFDNFQRRIRTFERYSSSAPTRAVKQVARDTGVAALSVFNGFFPPIFAPVSLGGARLSDPNLGIYQKFAPKFVQGLVGAAWPAVGAYAGMSMLGYVGKRFVSDCVDWAGFHKTSPNNPAPTIPTSTPPSMPGNSTSMPMISTPMMSMNTTSTATSPTPPNGTTWGDTVQGITQGVTNALEKKLMYDALATVLVYGKEVTNAAYNCMSGHTAPPPPGGGSVRALGASVDNIYPPAAPDLEAGGGHLKGSHHAPLLNAPQGSPVVAQPGSRYQPFHNESPAPNRATTATPMGGARRLQAMATTPV